MIIWLASYPKSGNTWVRTILGQILNDNFDSEKIFETSKKIRLYPSKLDFINLDQLFQNKVFSHDMKKVVFDKTVVNWIKSQNIINTNKKLNIFKTHNMLCKLKIQNKFYSFTSIENTIGVIHIVRDPRNVISSLVNHFSFENNDLALKYMLNENQTMGLEDNKIPQLLSSWNNHYNSWKRFPKNYFLIKYENLIDDPKKEVKKIIDYLNNFIKIKISEDNLSKIISNSSFKNLKNLEARGLFDENAKNKKTGEIKNFFNLGKKNNWKKILNKNILNKLEKNFHNEMKELGYM
tara:strand:- start:252 stop:1130 length:879 start_codon:yes stop_codon:yes gene_type:complete